MEASVVPDNRESVSPPDRTGSSSAAQQSVFMFSAGAADTLAVRGRLHVKTQRLSKTQSPFNSRSSSIGQPAQAGTAAPAVLPLFHLSQTTPHRQKAADQGKGWLSPMQLPPGQHTAHTSSDRQTGQQTAWQSPSFTGPSPTHQNTLHSMDPGQMLSSAFAEMSTNTMQTVTQTMCLQVSEAAWFRHPDLMAHGHRLLSYALAAYGLRTCLTSFTSTMAFSAAQPSYVNHVQIQTCQEDLALQDVEVIVNPTSTMLQTDQGVSKAIASAGGPTFLDSCNEILAASLGQLSRGDTAVTMMPATAAHGLKCRCVVHAVMPQRTGVESEDVDNVRHLVAIVLAEASRLSTKSIAIPLMGTGAAGWSLHVVAKALVTEVVETINVCGIGDALKLVKFVDLRSEAIAALHTELDSQTSPVSLTLTGTQASCVLAAQALQSQIQEHTHAVTVTTYKNLSNRQQQQTLLLPVMGYLQKKVRLQDGQHYLDLIGASHLISQVESHIQKLLDQNRFRWDCSTNAIPAFWAPQNRNTELFEVDLQSPEIASLMEAMHDMGHAAVIKVHRIQNKRLWKNYTHNFGGMKDRWPDLIESDLVNGGASTLWHGTSRTAPVKIYATELGFTQHFARSGIWGLGSYYSCRPALAFRYSHFVPPDDELVSTHLASCLHIGGLRQVLAVDVLTGKSKEMMPDTTLRIPPEVEDNSSDRAKEFPHVRYDSVCGIHTTDNTPIYITYNEARAYPKYLITYK